VRVWGIRVAWGYFALVVAFWLFLRQGDDWWPATAAMYAPRWPVALPLLVLIPIAIRWPRRAMLPVVGAAAIIAWPVLNTAVSLPALGKPPDGPSLRVMTFNADQGRMSLPAFQTLLAAEAPDVVAVQEGCAEMREVSYWGDDWHVQSGPSGLILACRGPIVPINSLELAKIGGTGGAMRCRIEGPLGKMEFVNVHLDTPRGALESARGGDVDGIRHNVALREAGSAGVTRWLATAPADTVVAGDFNMTTDSALFRRYWSPYCADAFEEASFGLGYTKHTSWHGVRIDHVLHGRVLTCVECRVCLDVGSDHRPVIAELRRAAK
jgi:endonuclease/exonuclease/phosphatase family metal-dependent hydrolase